ncbi:tRNA pseudouridine synthase B [Lishizhenia tianjinensis]|uniref:tRNA pseudouridine synthase B n=1 Tax=Lishizhenia tianjinensis TaxID=477690 RepID=A0A1I7B587_9FLAO|nr:tRNA pseudouridine(55) synthase TruB [Lishizhenia tianjinensis]SFT82337.1 tRNA pseudouridine synthase B [Lishizhenia tianjinensis]
MDFKAGEVLIVDKPLEWTSFDVVNKLRWKLRKKYDQKKFKVGHAGTLDPLASGLLIICTGKATKMSQELMAEDKTYTGTILLGKTTPSFDLETEYDQEFPTDHITPELLEEVRQSFIGEQLQTPPVFSAKKIDGKRAYESARKGVEIEMRKNLINITSFTIDSSRFPEIDFEVSCSKGTYIRSIASDFGKKLESGGTLTALRRTKSGDFTIDTAKTVDEWLEIIEETEVSATE